MLEAASEREDRLKAKYRPEVLLQAQGLLNLLAPLCVRLPCLGTECQMR